MADTPEIPKFYDPLDIQYGGVFQINDKPTYSHVTLKMSQEHARKYYMAKMHEAAKKHGLIIYDDSYRGCRCEWCRDYDLSPRHQVHRHAYGARRSGTPDHHRYHRAMAAWVMERLDAGEEIDIATGEIVL